MQEPQEEPRLLVTIEDRRFKYLYPPARLDGWREFAAGDPDLFQSWIKQYRDFCFFRRDQSHFLDLGRAMHAWLNGPEGLLERALAAKNGQLFRVELVLPQLAQGAAKLFWEAPWEILADSRGFWAGDTNLLYCPVRRLGKPEQPLPPSPYRLSALFMAAAPGGVEPVLNFEAEEAAILAATQRLPIDLTTEESGALPLLADCLAREPVDLLHISCHGKNREGPVLALEDQQGALALCSPGDLQRELAGEFPRLVFLSACQTGEPNQVLDHFAGQLLGQGARAVLGWAGSVADSAAIEFAAGLYGYLSQKKSLEHSLVWSRFNLLSPKGPEQKPSADWHLARLYLSPRGGGVLASGERGRKPRAHNAGEKEFLDKKGQKVPVAAWHEFVGRRHQIQTILREFQSSKPQHAGVLITGLGRQGKSSLAARVANRLARRQTAVVYEFYDAEDLLAAIKTAVGTRLADEKIAQALELVRQNPASLETSLREILQGPCRHYEEDQNGDPVRWPVLLVVDDFERVLRPPAQGEGLHTLAPELVPVYCALLNAFSRAQTESRLLITSRYGFALPCPGRGDAADGLLPVPLPRMSPTEGNKQALAKTRGANQAELANLDAERVAGCVEMAQGNPGLQNLLFGLAAQDPAQCDLCLQAMADYMQTGREPEEQKLLDFLGDLVLDRLLGFLNQGERLLLRASAGLSLPVPLAALAALGLHRPGQAPGERLLALGLWEEYPDPVDPRQKALAINPLARPKASLPGEEEQATLAEFLLPELFRLWGGEDGRKRPYSADIQLTTLALAAGDAKVLLTCAQNAVAALESQFNYRAAAALGQATIASLQEQGMAPPVRLLIHTSRVLSNLGEVGEAQKLLGLAVGFSQQGKAAISDYDLAGALREQAEHLVRAGQPDQALTTLQRAQELLAGPDHARERAVTLGDIARIMVDKGQVDQALKLHHEQLAVYEQLGDTKSRAVTLADIAQIELAREQFPEALAHFSEAYQTFLDLGDLQGICFVGANLGQLLCLAGERETGLAVLARSRDGFRQLGRPDDVDQMEELITLISQALPPEKED